MVGEDDEIADAAGFPREALGSFTAEQISSRLGDNGILSRMFGVRQSKIRSVDDYSQFLINAATSIHEKIDLGGIDSICSVARFFLGATDSTLSFELPCRLKLCGGSCVRVGTVLGTAICMEGALI